jgi:hypothetical protein
VRDNIGENIGGSLLEECRKRDVKSLFICPYRSQQNYAEDYLGRITAMASFAMVYSGAPLFMWIYATKTAVFVNRICASYYSKRQEWATPYELINGEPFPDASIVVPFGCAVLVLRNSDDRPKFTNRCTMMIFVHYSDDHPLFTYAVYSPRTKRVVHRQDCIFLTSVFPMRAARVGAGMGPDGDALVVFRSPESLRDGCLPELSFGHWTLGDPLPPYDDDVTGFTLTQPHHNLVVPPEEKDTNVPVHSPSHSSFPISGVVVPLRARPIVSSVSSGSDVVSTVPTRSAPQEQATVPGTLDTSGGGRSEAPPSGSSGSEIPPSEVRLSPPKRERVRLTIKLNFPGGERGDQTYSVNKFLSVEFFRRDMTSLLGIPPPVSLFVGPEWLLLDRPGCVSDQIIPGTNISCPFLEQGSLVRVEQGQHSVSLCDEFLVPPGSGEQLDTESASGDELSESHPAKRVHRAAPESHQSSSIQEFADELPSVTRSERTNLLKLFRKERKVARRIFRNCAQVSWDKDIAEHLASKENRPAEEFYPSYAEVEAEAFENYMFDKMCSFDQEYAEKLVEFRKSLRVAPRSLLPPVLDNPRLVQERTTALWEGLRRVYFGELERDDVPDDQTSSSVEVFPDRSTIDDLRREINELEARLARRRRIAAEDCERYEHDIDYRLWDIGSSKSL